MKKLLLLFISLAATVLQAQSVQTPSTAVRTVTISGRVLSAVDSTALAKASAVIAPERRYGATCDNNGNFVISNATVEASSYLEISYLGYETKYVSLNARSSPINLGNMYLPQQATEIEVVVIRAEVPMAEQRGDTTQFNAAAFKVSPDADADGLLAKMPGMVVENGKVEAQGEEVKKVYVDGKLWMGDDPIATLRNIPADAIESIQMFDEKSEESRLTGFDDGETARALNIVTKAKQNKAVIVRSEEAIGFNFDPDNRKTLYQINNNFIMFTPKHRFGASISTNNIGTSNSGRGFNVADGGSSPTGNRKTTLATANYSFESDKLKLSSSYAFNRNANSGWDDVEEFRRVNIADGSGDIVNHYYDYRHNYSNSRTLNRSHNVNLRLEWKPNDRHIISFRPNISFSDGASMRSNRMEQVDIADKDTREVIDSVRRSHMINNSENSGFSMNGNLSWLYRLNDAGTLMSLNVNYNLSNNTSTRVPNLLYNDLWNSETGTWEPSTATREMPRNTDSYNDQISTSLTISQPLSEHHKLVLALTSENTWANSTVKATNESGALERAQSTTIDRDYKTFGARMGYVYIKDAWRVDAGAEFRRLDQQRDISVPVEKSYGQMFSDFRPTLAVRYTVDRQKSLRFNYIGGAILPNLEQMAGFVDISSSGQNITIGNPNLKQGYQHRITMRYNSSNPEKSTAFNMSLNASIQSNFVSTARDYILTRDSVLFAYDDPSLPVVVDSGAVVTRYLNMNGYYRANLNAGYSFPLRAIRSNINLSAQYGITRSPSIYAERIRTGGGVEVVQLNNILVAHNINFRVGIASNISEKVDFNITSASGFNISRNTSRNNNNSFTESLSYTMNFILPASFTLTSTANWKIDRTWGATASRTANNSYVLMNVGIGKKLFKSKTGELRVTAYDLFNQNRSFTFTDTEELSRYSRSEVLGRYVLARFSYRFNSLRGNSAQRGNREMRDSRPDDGGEMRRYRSGSDGVERFDPGGGGFGGGMGPGDF